MLTQCVFFRNADGSIMSPDSHSSKDFEISSFNGESSGKTDADLNGSDILDDEEIDEIDTSHMEIYEKSSKKPRSLTSTMGSAAQKSIIQDSSIGGSDIVNEGESLLNSTKSIEPIDVDTMLNVLNDPGQSIVESSDQTSLKVCNKKYHFAFSFTLNLIQRFLSRVLVKITTI